MSTRELTLAQAVNEAFREELRRDPMVFVIGEDVAEAGTPFKVLSGLVEEFGTERVIDSPISEPGITGLGLGAAITGMRPVVDIMFGDFLTLIMDQVVNQAAKIHYMSGGSLKAPITVRTTLGATRRSGAQPRGPDGLRQEDRARDRDRRGPSELRRLRGARGGRGRRRVLASRRASTPPRRDGRADSVLAPARRRNRPHPRARRRDRARP